MRTRPAWKILAAFLHRAAFLPGAVLLAWPAIYNRYPLLFPDSISYINSGAPVARALFLRQPSDYYGMRSLLYALGIAPFHPGGNLWPVIALQAVLIAYVLWFVVQSFAPGRTAVVYYAIVIPLALFTGLGWVASIVMPDALGALLYLVIYLLVFGWKSGVWESGSRWQRLVLMVIAWWGATAHITHIMLGAGLCLFLLAALLVTRSATKQRLRGLAVSAGIIVAAILAHMAVHGVLYGKPTLNGERPAYLSARLLADGTGRQYLREYCPQAGLALCDYVQHLPESPDGFLWDDDGIWQTASPEKQALILRQETAFARGVIRAYPRQQLAISGAAFWNQLHNFDINNTPSPWLSEAVAASLPSQTYAYEHSRQAEGTLPNELLSTIQNWTVGSALALAVILVPFIWRRRAVRIVGLAAVVFPILVANALITGVLAEVDDRYQDRVIWLLPFFAGMVVVEFINQRRFARTATSLPAQLSEIQR